MKTFKEFTKDTLNRTPKESLMLNVHGKHAKLPKESLMLNVHGKHAKLSIIENLEPIHSYLDQNENENILDTSNHDEQMKNLHRTHRNSGEGVGAMYNYTIGSGVLNRNLFNNYNKNESLSDDTKYRVSNLDKHAFQKLKHPLHSYSGIGFDLRKDAVIGKSKDGNNVYAQPSYMSSSLSKHIAHHFASDNSKDGSNHIIHWHHKTDHPVGIVGQHSMFPIEHEILIPRTNSTQEKFHVEHLGTDSYEDHNGTKFHVHHVKRIPESEIIKS